MIDLVAVERINTMSSTQFAEMTGRERKEINKIIRLEFQAEIVGAIISPTLRPNGQVEDYLLPETESIMLAAKLDKTYLRKIAEFWKRRKEISRPPLRPRNKPSAGPCLETGLKRSILELGNEDIRQTGCFVLRCLILNRRVL